MDGEMDGEDERDETMRPFVRQQRTRWKHRTQRTRAIWTWLLRTCMLAPLLAVSACIGGESSQTSVTARVPDGPIKHIVFFIKENRTFDNYFGTYPGANG